MAELTLFARKADLEDLWEILLSDMRLKAVPDPHFGDLPPPSLSTRDDIAAHLREYPRVAPALGYFLLSDGWSSEPLLHARCDDNPNFSPHWYVKQRYGGPSIHFIPCFGYPRHDANGPLIAGSISDYPFYDSSVVEGTKLDRPVGLRETMDSIKRRLLEHGRYVASASGRRAIAMPQAVDAHKHGIELRQGNLTFAANFSSSGREGA